MRHCHPTAKIVIDRDDRESIPRFHGQIYERNLKISGVGVNPIPVFTHFRDSPKNSVNMT
jgi:hypothetical protein